eukprot:gene4635-4888_t
MPILPAGARLLVEFKAGRLIKDGTTVRPDTRKGLLRVIRTEDGLVHIEWYERKEDDSTETPEYDEIVFPDEAVYEKPSNVPARVYMIRFKEQADRDVMFWMQEPAESGDAELCERCNKAINTVMDADMGDPGAAVEDGSSQLQEMLTSDALLRGHVSLAPGAGAEAVAGDSVGLVPQAPGQAGPAQLAPAQLAALLSGMVGSAGAAGAAGEVAPSDPGASLAAALLAAMARQHRQQELRAMSVAPGPGLSEVLKPEVLAPLLNDPEMLDRLSEYLPEGHRSHEALRALAHSPHFQQQLATFSNALQTGQLDLAQFGLQAEGFTVADFLRAIQDLVDREQQR